MKKQLLITAMMMVAVSWGYAQRNTFWKPAAEPSAAGRLATTAAQPTSYKLFDLDLKALRSVLTTAPVRGASSARTAELIVSFPTPEGTLENFRVTEAAVLHPDLAAKYPGIASYAGQGIEDPTATLRFSVSNQLGFHGMVLSSDKHTYYIDPYSADRSKYSVYRRESLTSTETFQCLTSEGDRLSEGRKGDASTARTNDKKLRKYRLALSCNAEYGNIFAGSTGTDAQKKANILAQMNVTMTRVNGVYEHDLAVTMELVPNNDVIIYFGSTSADPWSGEYNSKTQQVIDAAIGNANYDIGHNFNTSGGGNAGCIACVCTTGSKGSGYTGSSNPTGDAFDIDYVAHEMGHQFGGYHTQSSSGCRSGNGLTEVEPGSGSTIMSYAGICPANVQAHSDAYFHYVNIRDISANIQTGNSASCATVVNLTNNPPTANAGADYVIPKSTAFVLRGQGSDPDGDAITFNWEQNDPGNPNSSAAPSPTRTVGPMFRSWEAVTSPDRYFPRVSDVVNNNLAPTWEVIPSVARTLNFALTVRDNKAGGGQTSDDLMLVTVNGTAGPFLVSAPNTAVSWAAGSSQTVTWSVASTNVAPVNCQNVNIRLSTDGGFTYPITLVTNTPNDGSQAVTVPAVSSSTCRIKVEAADNIFYDISNVNFSINDSSACSPTVPTGLTTSNLTSTSVTLTWNTVANATYDVQYRIVGASSWTVVSTTSPTVSLTGLTAATAYEAQVRSRCGSSTTSAYSASVNFTTAPVPLNYCTSSGNDVSDEYIGRVQIGTINNPSGVTNGYSDFTSLSTNLTAGTTYTITVTPTWTSTVYSEGYAAWIDYNRDGDFTDSGEQIWTRSASSTSPVSGTFTVPASAAPVVTRLRVKMQYSAIPSSPCGTFNYGEVEDYTVSIVSGTASATARGTEPTLRVEGSAVYVYPNPVRYLLTIGLPEGVTLQAVRIATPNGVERHVKQTSDPVVDVSELPYGLYILSVQTSQGLLRQKFVKEQ